MPDDLDSPTFEVTQRIQVPRDEFRFRFARSQGPGGQNVNKVNTKATLRWLILENETLPAEVRNRFIAKYRNRITKEGELVITSQRYRDQARNIQDCLDKLRKLLLEVARPPTPRKVTKPTKGSKVRRRKDKEAISKKKTLRKPPSVD